MVKPVSVSIALCLALARVARATWPQPTVWGFENPGVGSLPHDGLPVDSHAHAPRGTRD